MRRFLHIAVLLLLCGGVLHAQDTRKQENRKARLEKEIAEINRQLKENSNSSSKALTDLSLVRRKISARQELIAESDREIRALDDSMKVRQAEIDRLQARQDTLTLYYNRLVRSAYKNRDSRIWYMYILGSENIGQAARRFSYLKGFSREMSTQARRIRETTATLEVERERLARMKDEAESIRLQRQSDMESLRSEENESAALVAQLQQDRKKYQKELEKKNREVEALNREIAEIIRKAAAERKKAEAASSATASNSKSGTGTTPAKGGKSTSTSVDDKLSADFAANKGRLPWPASGTVVDSFGQHYHPVYKNVKLPPNNGVTIAVARGTQARAVFDGTVAKIVVIAGYGQCVLIQHGTYFTFYCKLKSASVKAGDKVRTGQVVGVVDTISGEDQLHFQLWKDLDPQDPEKWLK